MKNTFILILFFLFLSSCKDEPITPKPEVKLMLSVEDVSCTEAWVQLSTNNLQLPTSLNLLKDDNIIKTINLQTADTLLYIDSLLPNQTYNIQAFTHSNNQSDLSSNELSVTTMDTTSHNFTWQTFSFGGGGEASFINDISIIDENNIWAVGEIYLPDSLGNPDNKLYNALHWDGNNWIPKRISAEFRGNIITPAIGGVQAFSATDIWFTSSLPIHGDGTSWKIFDIRTTTHPNLVASKCWGTSSINMYFVGALGSIAYYNGQSFSKIESETEQQIYDIWGVIDNNGGSSKYLAVEDVMLKIDNNNNLTRINAEPGRFIISIWGISDKLLYTAGGDGLELFKNNGWEKINIPDVNNLYRVKGQNYNDVFGISAVRTILHFNGFSWQTIQLPTNDVLLRLDVKENIVACVGWKGDRGVITIGIRN